MSYYTQTIPVTLAEKLKEKHCRLSWTRFKTDGHYNCTTTYAAIFDWLMERDIIIILNPCYNATEDTILGWVASVNLTNKVLEDDFTFGFTYEEHLTWHNAANAAIEKALTLI